MRFEAGKDYPIWSKKGSLTANERKFYSTVILAKANLLFQLGGLSVKPDNKLSEF
jgi:oligopeptidase B